MIFLIQVLSYILPYYFVVPILTTGGAIGLSRDPT